MGSCPDTDIDPKLTTVKSFIRSDDDLTLEMSAFETVQGDSSGKKSYRTIIFLIFPRILLANVCSKNTIKKIGHRACLGDIKGQTYPIYASTGTYHARYFISSRYILLQLETRVFKVKLDRKRVFSVWDNFNI